MAKIFQTVVKRTTIIIPPSGDTVLNERLVYDRPEVVPSTAAKDSLIPRISEQVNTLTEEVVAALLARAEESNPVPVETIRSTVRPMITEVVNGQTENNAVKISSSELVGQLVDSIQALLFVSPDILPTPEETVVVSAKVNALETVATLTENITGAIVAQDNGVPVQTTSEPIVVTLNGYANVVASNTGWTNPNNALGNTTGTSATLTATASGLAGTTNNTTNGTIVLDFQDVNLGDLTITNVDFNVETQRANAGVPIAQPTSNVQFQYSFDNTNWTTITTVTAVQAKAIQSVDVTAIVGQDQTKLSNLKIRATGSVTSGTGLGVSTTVSFFRAWMVVNADKTY
jgi:hypothetical protein